MRVEFDDWERSGNGETAFFVEMECAPLEGQTISMHKSLFPPIYHDPPDNFEYEPGMLTNEFNGGDMVDVIVLFVAHEITPDGHTVAVGFRFTCLDEGL